MKKHPSEACKEAADALTLGDADEMSEGRAWLHLKHCEACQEDAGLVDELRDAVLAVDDRLDDLTRARVQTRLAEAMEQASREGEDRTARWNSRTVKLALGIAAAALLVAAASLLWRTETPRSPAPEKQMAVKPPAPAPVPAPVPDTKVLQPSAIINGAQDQVALGKKVARLQLPAGVDLKANLAQGAKLALYGPVDLAVKEADSSHTELNLSAGSMVVDYDAGKGKLLRIVSPGAVTEVVGTLFSVEVQGEHTLVSVSHGKVRVRSGGASIEVLPGQTWSSEHKSLAQTSEASAKLFGQKEPVAKRDIPSRRVLATRSVGAEPAPAVPQKPADQAPNPTPSPAPAKVPVDPTAAALYAQAEAALAHRDQDRARKILTRILKHHPRDPLADTARYELALMLVKAGRTAEAGRLLKQMNPESGSRLEEPAHFLRCRIMHESGQRMTATGCFRSFREKFPASPHGERARAALKELGAKE